MALAAYLVLKDDAEESDEQARTADAEPEKSKAPELLTTGRVPGPGEARAAKRAAAARAKQGAKDKARGVRGTLVLIGEDGSRDTKPDGRLSLQWDSDDSSTNFVEVNVTNGLWSLPLARADAVATQLFRTHDRVAYRSDKKTSGWANGVALGADGRVHLEYTWAPPLRLHVLDAETGGHLTRVQLVTDMDEGFAFPKTVQGAVMVTSAASPIEVPIVVADDLRSNAALFVRSAGYAWQRIVVDTLEGGDRTMTLQLGGGADITVRGKLPGGTIYLRLWREDDKGEQPYFEREIEFAGLEAIRSLQLGAYEAKVQIGEWWSNPRDIAKGTLEVEAGTLASLTLDLKRPGAVRRVPFAGELIVPASLTLTNPEVVLQFTGDQSQGQHAYLRLGFAEKPPHLVTIEGRPGAFQFDAGPATPGPYQVTINEIGYRGTLVLGPNGTTRARIVVPEPGALTVRVVDATTGEDAGAAWISWHMVLLDHGGSHRPTRVNVNPKTKRFHLRVPSGRIALSADSESFSEAVGTVVDVPPGGSVEHTLRVTRSGSFLLVLREGKARVPFDWDWNVDVTGLDGESEAYMWGENDKGQQVWVDKPGRYKLAFPLQEGFEKVPDLFIDVAVGKVETHTVQLRRKR